MATTPSQQDIQALTNAITKLNNAMGGGNRSSSWSSSRSSNNTNSIDIDKLKNEVKNSGSIINQLNESYKKMFQSIKGAADIYDKLERSTRNQSDQTRKINKNLTDFIAKTGDSVNAIEQLTIKSKNLQNSIKSYDDKLGLYKLTLNKLNDLSRVRVDKEKALTDAQQKYAQAQEKVNKAQETYESVKKKKKNSADAQAQLEKVRKEAASLAAEFRKSRIELNRHDKEIDNNIKEHEKYTESLDENIAAIEKHNEITGALNSAQLIYLKNYKQVNTSDKQYIETLAKLKASSEDFDHAVGVVSDVVEDRAKNIGNAFDNFGKALKHAAWELFTIAPKIAYGDLMAQLRNNVNQSDYSNDIRLGISETQRSDIIGQNRTGLRVLGNGNEQQGLTGGGAQLQRSAWQYGVQGADALRLGLQYQNSYMNMGYAGNNTKGVAEQMTIMHNMAAQLGVTDDALKDFYDSLTEMGATSKLNIKNQNLSEDERRKALNKEYDARIALTKELGISLDKQKQLNQQAINNQYGDIATTIKQSVGRQIQISQYNSQNPKNQISQQEQAIIQKASAVGGEGGLSIDEQKIYSNAMTKMSRGTETANQKAIQQGTLGARINFLASNVVAPQALGIDVGGETTDFLNRGARQQGQAGQAVVQNSSYTDLTKNIINTTNNAFIPFNNAVMEATQYLHGLAENPAGKAISTAGSATGSFLGSLAGNYIANKGIGGAINAGKGVLGKIATSRLGQGVGGLASRVAPALGPLAAVAGAGYGGWQVGSFLNDHLYEGTNAGDRIGAATTWVMARLGSKEAQEAEQNMQKYGGINPTAPAMIASPPSQSSFSGIISPDDLITPNLSDPAKDKMNENIEKLVKINQAQLDVANKDSQKQEQDQIKPGDTLNYYKNHTEQTRRGLERGT